MTSPIIILIRPQMGENIGAVARAMANFGLLELRIVAPRDGWPNPHAEAVATGNANDILKRAVIFNDVSSALANITHAYATTARPRELMKRVVTPEEAAIEITRLPDDQMTRSALVFGPERTGLENDDLALCNTLITIPTTEHASLNLAQSVVVLGYEWFKQSLVNRVQSSEEKIIPAPLAQYENLFGRLEHYLDETDFFKVAEKKPAMMANIKTMLLRGNFTEQEVRTLHGILKALAE